MPKIKLYNNYEDPNIFSTPLTKPLSQGIDIDYASTTLSLGGMQ
jgi:hypothetical protein